MKRVVGQISVLGAVSLLSLLIAVSCGGGSDGGESPGVAVISVAEIPGVVVPVRDAVPVTTAIDTEQYTGTISWAPGDNPFKAATVYTATVIVTPKPGFTLTGVAENFFTVAGAAATNAADSGAVTAVFPATGAASDIEITFQSAVQAGGVSGTTDSTGLTLSFSADPVTLTAENITVTGATKGALSGTGATRHLAISGITVANGSTVSVTVASPAGYAISGSPRTAVVYKDEFSGAGSVGTQVTISVGAESLEMIYVNNQTGITFPFSPSGTPANDQKATLTRKFFASATQVTNAQMVQVLQWAYDNGKFSSTLTEHNGIGSTTVKYGSQELLDLDATNCRINYLAGSFTVAAGYEGHPAVCVTWYGAVMFCNWLTEMIHGATSVMAYSGIDSTWGHTETSENADGPGYRLLSIEEWEYAARYIGTTVPTDGDLALQYIARNVNSGHNDLSDGYYWTPGDYASGALKAYTDETETRAVGWYAGDADMGGSNILMPVKQKRVNKLGLFDMSGNVWEWCFPESGSLRVLRGSSWANSNSTMCVGYWIHREPTLADSTVGFRIARTQ